MKKLFGTMAFAAALFAGYSAYEAQNSVNLNDVALANVEALAGDADVSEFNCIKEKDSCSFTITSESQISLLSKHLTGASASVGTTIDLSNGTQIYSPKKWFWQTGVRCGTDVTCNDLLKQLGL